MTHPNYAIKVSLISLLISSAPTATAQFNPELLNKSVVRITVEGGGKKPSGGTGFVWQKPNQIVTSLHLMRNGDDVEITVEHKKVSRTARVDRVLVESDLVLLEVTEQWDPTFKPISLDGIGRKPTYGSQITALGYNSGAPGSSTRQMKKGFAEPEILKTLLPTKDRITVEEGGMPSIDLPIYYLEGSLLPGFSGSPVFDVGGNLIGVGDGGLENGASNVSWVIPATDLVKLTNSGMRILPDNITSVSTSFSADLDSSETYVVVNYSGYEFVKTKTRSFSALLESTEDPAGLTAIATSFLPEYNIDYLSFKYDIYEDVNNGLIIALPADVALLLDDEGDLLADYDEDSPWDISYVVMSVDDLGARGADPEALLNLLADQYLADQNSEEDMAYVENDGARYIDAYGGNRFVLRSAFNDLDNDLVDDNGVDYITFATNLETVFLSRGVMDRFDKAFINRVDSMTGLNCSSDSLSDAEDEVCNDLEEMLLIVTSVHMTSFANTSKSQIAGR